MKTKVLAIIIAAVLLLGVGTGIGFAIYGNLPQNVAATAIFNAIDDFGKRDEIKPIVKTLTKGSFEFALNELKNGEEDILEDGALSGKMYFSKDALMLENFEFKAGEFGLSGDIYLSEDLLYVSEDEILKNAYGVKFKDIVDDLENSIFAYGSGSEYAIPDEQAYEYLISALNALNDEKMHKDAEKIVEKIYKKMWKIACDNFEFESEKDEIKVGGSREKVRVISIVIEGEALAEAISEFYDYLAEDKSIPEFLEKYEDSLAFMSAINGSKDKTPVEFYEEYIELLGENIDDLCDSIERNYSDDIVINVVTPRISKKLVKLEVVVNDVTELTLDFGMDGIKKTDKMSLEVDGQKTTYQVKKDDSKEFECVIKQGDNSIKLSIDKKKDEFTFDIDMPANYDLTSLVIKGDWVTKLGKSTVTIDKIRSTRQGYDEYYNFGEITETVDCEIVLIFDQSDKIPQAPKKYDRISDITEEDIKSWEENYKN